MAKTCFVCGNRIGLFSSYAVTKDKKYICVEDANYYFGENPDDNKIPFALKNGISNLTSSDVLNEIENIKQEHEKQQEEYENQIDGYRILPLSSVARKVEGINLKKNEYGYYAYNDNYVTWYEERSRTKRINYRGPMGSIHIAKGLNYRLGSIKTDIEHETYLKEIFKGYPLLTNKRIILGNQNGVKSYPFTRLLKTIPYQDGVVLCSDSGKKVILEGFKDATPFNILLDRLLTEEDVLPK